MSLVLLFLVPFAYSEKEHNYRPKQGYVADEKTAVKVAIAILEPLYGVDKIQEQLPFTGTLNKNVWTVTGSLPSDCRKPENDCATGVASIYIDKITGKILRVTHDK